MATKCDVPNCQYMATSGNTKCLQHTPKRIPVDPALEREGYAIVPVTEIPANARYNEVAGKIFAVIKTLMTGHALKLSLNKFTKPNLITAQRYALDAGMRIGVRITGSTAYLWRMTEEECAKVDAKAARMRDTKAKHGKKVQAIGAKK